MSELDPFCAFCARVLISEQGGPLIIEDWQRRVLTSYFAGRRETALIVPKKNGKSSLLASIALYHLLVTPFADVIAVASSRDQAGLILNAIDGFIQRSPALRARLKRTRREIRDPKTSGRIRILSSDSDTCDGERPTLALVDELHRHRDEELYSILRDGLGPRHGQLITISTAEERETSPLGRLRRAVYELPGMEIDGPYRHVDTGTFAWHEWRLEDGADPDDLEAVLRANPASWVDRAELEARRTASMRPWQWRRFTCNLPGGPPENSAISELEWRACAQPGVEIPAGAAGVIIGVDLAWVHDHTAIVPIWRSAPGAPIVVNAPVVLEPPADGTSLSVEHVFGEVSRMAVRWPKPRIVLDPRADGRHFGQRVEAELDLTAVEHEQSHGPMILAAQRLTGAIGERQLQHPDDPTLNAHVLGAGVRPVGEAWRLTKNPGGQKIDACIALAMAISVLLGEPPPKPPNTIYFDVDRDSVRGIGSLMPENYGPVSTPGRGRRH